MQAFAPSLFAMPSAGLSCVEGRSRISVKSLRTAVVLLLTCSQAGSRHGPRCIWCVPFAKPSGARRRIPLAYPRQTVAAEQLGDLRLVGRDSSATCGPTLARHYRGIQRQQTGIRRICLFFSRAFFCLLAASQKTRQSPRTRMRITLRKPRKIIRNNIFRYKPMGLAIKPTAQTMFFSL